MLSRATCLFFVSNKRCGKKMSLRKPSDHFQPCLARDIKGDVGLEAPASTVSPRLRRVRFSIDLPARESFSECGDGSAASHQTLFEKVTATLKENLETEKGVLDLKLSMSEWDIHSGGTDVHTTQSALDGREEEFLLVVKSRDEALKEIEEIKGLMNTSEEKGKRKVTHLWRKLERAKGDNLKVTSMLQGLLVSHRKLEKALEEAHVELGRKDSEIAGLKKDRTQSHQKIQKLQAELEQCQSKLASDPQHGIQTNSAMQDELDLAKEELRGKEAEYQQLRECRDQLIEEAKMEAKLCAERLETLKKQFQIEREAIKKAAQKESAELKKALEEAYSKSVDVSRCNRELRAKVAELEEALAGLQEKEIELELRQMEEMKEQYQKKNHEQAVSIREFVTALAGLQNEMQQLARNQEDMALQNRNLERRLELERQQRQQLEEQCKTLEETVRCLKKCKGNSEKKLKEASIESEQITANLEEAHNWFKSKFDSLQQELAKNRQQRIPEEQGYAEEERPVKLPRQACLKRWETKQQLKFIARKYLS